MNDTSQIYEAMFSDDSKADTSKDNLDVMPAIMSQAGLTPRFEKFYDKLKHGLFVNNATCLYNLSEHALAYDDFAEMYDNVLGKSLAQILSLDNKRKEVKQYADLPLTYHVFKSETRITKILRKCNKYLLNIYYIYINYKCFC